MRKLLALAALTLSSACVHLPPLVATAPEQAIPTDPRSATAGAGKVRVTARPDRWRGWPSDLDDYVTPVEVLIENHSDKEIAVAHTHFSLLLPTGFRYDALSGQEVRHLLGTVYGGAGGYGAYGAWGGYAWPGLYMPWPYVSPYAWWGVPWWGDPWYGPPPALPPRAANPTPSGKLVPGGKVSLLVIFPVPAERVSACTCEAQVVAADGGSLGTVKLPFERRGPGSGVPVSASPILAPPPSAPPPAPPAGPPPAQ